jgi:hypothetical protein
MSIKFIETHVARITPDVIRIARAYGVDHYTFYIDIANRKYHISHKSSHNHGETFEWDNAVDTDSPVTNSTYIVTEDLATSAPYCRNYFYESRGVKLRYDLSLHLALSKVSLVDDELADYLQYVYRCLTSGHTDTAFNVLDSKKKHLAAIVDKIHINAMNKFKWFQVN